MQFFFHLIRVWLTQFRPGGVKALTWEVIALRQQVIVLQRKQRSAPHLTMWDRLIFAYSTGRVSLKRLKKVAIAVKPSMFFKFHKALVSGKYRILFSRKNKSKSGPKGPSEEVIKLILELKQRNPSFGYLRIAMQVNDFLGTKISKECVGRILKKHELPDTRDDGPSWLTFLGNMQDSLWSLDLFRCESVFLKSHWIMIVMDQFSRRIIGFSAHGGTPDGEAVCRMLNRIACGNALPIRLSTDNDPLFKYYRFKANLRVLEISEVKSVPYTPQSHPFIERLIGTTRRECLDKTFFLSSFDLQKKLDSFKQYYNEHRCHSGVESLTPLRKAGQKHGRTLNINEFGWQKYCNGLFQLPFAA